MHPREIEKAASQLLDAMDKEAIWASKMFPKNVPGMKHMRNLLMKWYKGMGKLRKVPGMGKHVDALRRMVIENAETIPAGLILTPTPVPAWAVIPTYVKLKKMIVKRLGKAARQARKVQATEKAMKQLDMIL